MTMSMPRVSVAAASAGATGKPSSNAASSSPTNSSSISRFFSASPESLWMAIVETQPALVASAQTLFEQITSTRQAPLRSTSLHHHSHHHHVQDDKRDKLWAVVAVAATAIAQDLSHERQQSQANGTTHAAKRRAVSGRKRKMRDNDRDDDDDDDRSSVEEVEGNEKDGDQEREDTPSSDDASMRSHKARGVLPAALPQWHLVDFLVEANVTMSSFLEALTSLFDRLLLDPELLQVATLLKEEFTIATVLFEKFRVMWKKFALHSLAGTDPAPAERTELLLRLGWLLFLVMRRRFAGVYAGLGHLYYLLLAVLKLTIGQVHDAPSQAQPQSQSPSRSLEAEAVAALNALASKPSRHSSHNNQNNRSNRSPTTTKQLDDQRLMNMLCSTPKVDAEEVTKAYAHVTAVVRELVRENTLAVDSRNTPTNGGDRANSYDATTVDDMARGICANETLRQNTLRLVELYASENLTAFGGFDERVYLNEQSRHALLGPRAPATHSTGNGNGDNNNSSSGDSSSSSSASSSFSHGVPPPSLALGRSDPRTPSSSALSSPVHHPMTPSHRDASSSCSTPSGGAMPPSPFTVQAWQWHGSSPPPSLPRGLNTPTVRTLGGGSGIPQSPFVAQTPITAALEISSWIRDTVVAPAGGGGNTVSFVSFQLQTFFQNCASDPTDHIADVLSEMSHKLLTSRRRATGASGACAAGVGASQLSRVVANGNASSEVDGSLRKTTNLSVALFYRVLEALLVSERERLKTSNFSSLLHNETFLSSLFACSLEVGLKVHSLITLSFPFLLDTVGVNAFDFGKVIESFVKHVPRLPTTLKRHMRDLEQVILDSLAWRSDSRLYVVLKGERQPQQQPPATTAPTTATTGDGAAQETAQTPAPATTATPTTTTTTTAPRATVLQLFFRKVLSLAATRIFRLGSMLDLEAAHMNQVWSAIKECMSSQVHLLKDRHLDQIILCSIYGVCKVNKLASVTFNRIIEQYKKLQAAPAPPTQHGTFHATSSLTRKTSDVIRDIKLDDGDATGHATTRGDVIKFYNRCYIPAMKVFLLQYQAQDKQVAAANAAVASAAAVSASGSRDGHLVTPSTSDSEIVAEAAVSAVEKVMQSYAPPLPRTPVRGRPAASPASRSSPSVFGSPPSRSLPMFTSAEVESLPVSVHQSSPKRVLASNIYMSPLQNARYQTQRAHMTPRSHALYAFGESPSRDLALINRAVNNGTSSSSTSSSMTSARTTRPLTVFGDDSDATATSGSSSSHTTPTTKRRRT